MKNELSIFFGVILLASLLFFTKLGAARLWDRDEPRNAGCTVEMLQRGDWVVPVFNRELRPHKPVLLYWLMMGSYALCGVNEFGARAVSALLSVGTVGVTFAIGRRLFGSAVGAWAGSMLATCAMFCLVARAATPDATLIFLSTTALGLFVYAAFDRRGELPPRPVSLAQQSWPFPASWRQAGPFYAVMALATLAKGPVGLVLPTAVIGMFCLVCRLPERDITEVPRTWHTQLRRVFRPFAPRHFLATCWAMRPLTALGMTAAIAGPWYAWVGVRTGGDWLVGFLGEHNVGRALAPMEGHGGPFYYYAVAILIGLFPWSVVAIPTGLHNWRDARAEPTQRAAIYLLFCWVGVYCLIFTVARTKLPSYVVPAYPALTLLVARFVHAAVSKRERVASYWMPLGFAILAMIGVLGIVALAVAATQYLRGDVAIVAIGFVPLLTGVSALAYWRCAGRRRGSHVMLAGAVLQGLLVFGWLAARVSEQRDDLQLLAAVGTEYPGCALATFQRLEPSWVFYAGRPIATFDETNLEQLRAYVSQEKKPCVITTAAGAVRLRQLFPGVWRPVSQAEYFLRTEQLVALRPEFPAAQQASQKPHRSPHAEGQTQTR